MTQNCDSMSSSAVYVHQLLFSYGRVTAANRPQLDRVDLNVPQGVIYGLLGPSGCGKTTLLRCIIGRLKPQKGIVNVFNAKPGKNILRCVLGRQPPPQHGIVRIFGKEPGSDFSPVPGCGVGYMPQELALFPEFTIKETLRYFGLLYRMSPKEIKARTKFLVSLLHLPDKNRLVAQLSGGQQRRVSLAAALVHHPPLLILDEPTVGVDPVLRQAIWEHLDTLCREHGLTVIITTHYIEEARRAQTVGLMRFGRLLVESNPEKLLEHHRLDTLEAVFLKLCRLDSARVPDVAHVARDSIRADASPYHRKQNGISTIAVELKNMRNLSTVEDAKQNENNNKNHNNINNNQTAVRDEKQQSNGNLLVAVISTFRDVSAGGTPASLTPVSERSSEAYTGLVRYERRRAFDTHRVTALFVKNMVRLKRNMHILLFYFLLPSIQIALFCICIGQDPKNINVAVFNEEELTSGEGFGLAVQYLHYIDKDIVVQTHYDSLDKARQAVIDGKVWAALHFSANFSASLDQRRKDLGKATNDTIAHSNIKLYLDMSNQVIGFVLLRTFFKAFQTFAHEFLALLGFNAASVTLPLTVEKVIYGSTNPSMTEFMAPGVTILIAFYATTALTALSLVLERKDGLLERSLVAGVTSIEFLVSHIITQTFVLTVAQVFMLITTFGVFGVPSRGPMIWVFSLTFFQGIAGVMFGLFISSLCADEVSAAMLGMGSFFPTIMLGGIFWPIQSMPDWMARFASFLPQTLPVEAMRFILSRGWDVSYYEVIIGFIATWCWIVIYFVAAAFIFKKYA